MKKKELFDFKKAVCETVKSISQGKVMTYGQIAGILGHPRAAQMVGWILHWAPLHRALPGRSDQKDIPYQRVVNRFGGLASGYTTGGREGHRKDLEDEDVKVRSDYTINLEKYLWRPEIEFIKK